MAQPLYPGCDVWLNNPLRPLEACGTSGMKAALNGGLNLSILDGWWDEWYDGNNGWAIPTADGVDDQDRRDDLEATALYDLIENEVAAALLRPSTATGVPTRWLEMVRHTLQVARPQGAGHPDGARLRPRALRPGGARRPRGARLRLHRGPRARRAGSSTSAAPGARCASSTSSPRASATPPRWAPTLAVRAYVALGDLSADDVEVAGRPRPRRRRRRPARPR